MTNDSFVFKKPILLEVVVAAFVRSAALDGGRVAAHVELPSTSWSLRDGWQGSGRNGGQLLSLHDRQWFGRRWKDDVGLRWRWKWTTSAGSQASATASSLPAALAKASMSGSVSKALIQYQTQQQNTHKL